MIAPNTRILWLPGEDARNWDYETGGWASSNRNPSGVKVDAETALKSTVVLACMRVLSTSVAGLPLHIYRRLRDGGKEIAREHPLYRILHTSPNNWQTSVEWREQLMLHMLAHGQAFNEKLYAAGQISEIIPLHPSRMKTEQLENMRLRYTYREDKGSSTVYTQDAIMHIRGMSDDGVNGMSMIELARDAIGLARACEIHGATFFGNGARPGVILSTDQMLSPEAAENTRNQWERAHRGPDRSNRTAVLQGGLKVSELGGNNQESQFLEARRFQVEEVCRVFGVPPHLVGDLSRSSFSNIEQQTIDYYANGLMPWLRRIESAISRDLLDGDDEYFAEFDTRGALRADAAGRSAFYNTLWNLGVLSVNEIRSLENLNPVDGGDTRFVQLNMTTLDKAAAEPEVPAAVEEIVTVEESAATPADAPTVIEVLDQYRSGSLTLEGAKALLMVSFPQTPEAMIDAILAGVVVKQPEPVAPEPVAETPATVAASLPASRDCGTGAGGFKPGNKCAGEGGGGSSGGDEISGGGSKRDQTLDDWRKSEGPTLSKLRQRLVDERDFADQEIASLNERRQKFSKQYDELSESRDVARDEYKAAKKTLSDEAMTQGSPELVARLQAMDPVRRELFLMNNKSDNEQIESLRQSALAAKEKSLGISANMLKVQNKIDDENKKAAEWSQFQREAGWAAIKEYSMSVATAGSEGGGFAYSKDLAGDASKDFSSRLNTMTVQASVSDDDRNYFEQNAKGEATRFLATVMNPADPAARNLTGAEINVASSNSRAYSIRDEIHVSPYASTATVVHELGHVYESGGEHVLQSAVAFHEHRCKTSDDVKMSDISSSFGYSDKEVGNSDNFEKVVEAVYRDSASPGSEHVTEDIIKSRAAYLGKVYRDENGKVKATELVTIGLEMMHHNPAAFAKADPEYFDFMLSVVSGKARFLRGRSSR